MRHGQNRGISKKTEIKPKSKLNENRGIKKMFGNRKEIYKFCRNRGNMKYASFT